MILLENSHVFKRSGKLFKTTGKIFKRSGRLFKTSGKIFKRSGKLLETSGKIFKRSGKLLIRSAHFFEKIPRHMAGQFEDLQIGDGVLGGASVKVTTACQEEMKRRRWCAAA